MSRTRKDALATGLIALALLAFLATWQSWNVWLIGSSHRWAAGAIVLLGVAACSFGAAWEDIGKHTSTMLLAAVGTATLPLSVWAVWTGSLTALSLLVGAIVVLWAGATLRHTWHHEHRAIPA